MPKFISLIGGFGVVVCLAASSRAQTITNQPQSITINNASTAAFSVGASGASSYQWKFNGTNLSDTGNVSGSTTATLTIEDVSSNQAGTYTVVINNSVTSANAVLTVVPGTIVTFTFSGLIGGTPTANVHVQLFDHDKPATVQNFLHYILSGAYTNMFMDRCLPGFVLQGGDFGASNRTSSTPPPTGWNIATEFSDAPNQNPPFPAQLASEYYTGPQIKNDFGTLAVALRSSIFGQTLPNSGQNAFYFNLADNSTNLDSTNNGPFTVFGRILDGTNVLQYFNELGVGNGIVLATNIVGSGQDADDLPVNYQGNGQAANANLVFCDFAVGNTVIDTTPPTVSVTSPTPGAILTNGPVIQGTASDNIGLADVICILTPQADGGVYANNGVAVTNIAARTTNWSLDESGVLLPGTYALAVQSQDGAGNLSTTVNQSLTLTGIATNGDGAVTFVQGAPTTANPIGYPLQAGSNYVLQETPAANSAFLNWGYDGVSNITPQLSFTMEPGTFVTATFVSNAIPDGVTITPLATGTVIAGVPFTVSGSISPNLTGPVTITCTVYSQINGNIVLYPVTTTGTTTWSVTESNLDYSGNYFIQVLAVDKNGKSSVVTGDVTVTVLEVSGNGAVGVTQNGTAIANPLDAVLTEGTTYVFTATPAAGNVFLGWSFDGYFITNSSITITYYDEPVMAEFIETNTPKNSKGMSFTYPPANAAVTTNSFLLKGRVTAAVKTAQVACTISSLTTGIQVSQTLTATASPTWEIAVTNLLPDNYLLEAIGTNASGFSSVISEKFSVINFKDVAGTYNGLFFCANGAVAATNSGFFTLTVGASGSFSGRMYFPGYRMIPVTSKFYSDGSAPDFGINYPHNAIAVSLGIDVTNGLEDVTGYVFSQSNTWYSPLICYRSASKLTAETKPAAGKYLLDLDYGGLTNAPETNGYASVSVSGSGTVTAAGALPDGSPFSQSTRIATNGIWPLYATPTGYKTNGIIMGWVTNLSAGGMAGQLYWLKAGGTGSYYVGGVNTNMSATGTNYAGPAAGNYTIVFEGGALTAPVTNALSVVHNGAPFRPVDATDKLSISLSGAGVLTGHFSYGGETLQFKGGYFGEGIGGSGFILEPNGQTGQFTIQSAGN